MYYQRLSNIPVDGENFWWMAWRRKGCNPLFFIKDDSFTIEPLFARYYNNISCTYYCLTALSLCCLPIHHQDAGIIRWGWVKDTSKNGHGITKPFYQHILVEPIFKAAIIVYGIWIKIS